MRIRPAAPQHRFCDAWSYDARVSYDLSVSVPAWRDDTVELWLAELRLMGIEVTVPTDFAFPTAAGWLPVTVTLTPVAAVPYAREFRALGTFESGFELAGSANGARFSTGVSEGNAVAVWCAAALAAVTKGTLTDPQATITAKAPRGEKVLAKLMADTYFARGFTGPKTMDALPPLKPKKATKPAGAARAAVAAVEADLSRPVRTYAASARFEVGERVAHPTFGEGVVEASEPGKVTAFFADGRRMLAQSRDGALVEALPGRRAIDHAAPTPGSKPGR